MPDSHRRGDVGLTHQIGAELLQGCIGIQRLVVGIGVDQGRGFVGHHLLQDRRDRLSLGKPLAANFCEEPRRIRLVQHDCPGRPAIGKGEPIQLVQDSRRRRSGKAHDGQHAQVAAPEHRLQAANHGLIGKQRIKIHRHVRYADPLTFGRYGRMQVGQGLGIIQPGAFGHKAFDELQDPIGSIDEAVQHPVRVRPICFRALLVEQSLGTIGLLRRR